MRILITSVGSLVGQNILDVLESPLFKGRQSIEIIGTNSIASNPQNFRCNRTYLVSNTVSPEFHDEFTHILNQESPDLILSGRDEDTLQITKIVRNMNINSKLPYGSLAALDFSLNKLKTSQFCLRHNLPFADSFVLNQSGDFNDLVKFARKNEYPLVAKPIQGFASKGVFFICSDAELEYAAKFEGYMFQEYLGDGSLLKKYFESMQNLVPLFAHAPDITHNSCHAIIRPDGSFDDIFISKNEHESGVTVGFKRIQHDELYCITKKFLSAIYEEGGYGPVTIQFRQDKYGNWKAQEMNMRTNGNTYPRFILGQDDIGEIINYLYPEAGISIYRPASDVENPLIGKVLTSYVMKEGDLDQLKKESFVEIK